jgi:DnaJ family protein A protein 2
MESQNYYYLLGIDTNASLEDIRKAYKKLAIKHHPDKGGDIERFREIGNAYETLSNTETRSAYDTHLHNQQHMNNMNNMNHMNHMNPMDIFNKFFNNNFDGFESIFFNNINISKSFPHETVTSPPIPPIPPIPPHSNHPNNKCADLHCNIEISLDDVYYGKNIKLVLNVEKLCDDCIGVGYTISKFINCEDCNGIGMLTNTIQMGPHIFMETKNTCVKCNGNGKVNDIQYICKICNGSGVMSKNIIQDIKIPSLIKNNTIIKLNNIGIEKIGFKPGDIIVHVITADKNDTFIRLENNDLFIKKDITLAQSLCGVDFNIKHISGKVIKIISKPDEIIKPDDIRKIYGEGLDRDSDLVIQFNVIFPCNLDNRDILKDLLFYTCDNDIVYDEKKILSD